MTRRTFFSFHYLPDSFRAGQVRNMGMVDGNVPVSDNDWETVTQSGDAAIERWIAGQMEGRSATVVLVGSNTANRKWINYEIIESWNDGMGVVGIHVHGLKGSDGSTATMGANPFDSITHAGIRKLSSIAKCYNPPGSNSTDRYDWIKQNLAAAVEEALSIRQAN